MARRSDTQIADSREQTLEAAVQVASVLGLDGLTIGTLADELHMSKSGLIGRFGSKEELQLQTLERAAEMFIAAVWTPAADATPGLQRLNALCDAWVAYLADPPFRGGCFLTTATVEFDGRDGAVRDAVKAQMTRWLSGLEREAATAVADGELPAGTDPAGLAFTINALATGANCHFQLFHDPRTLATARAAMARVIETPPSG